MNHRNIHGNNHGKVGTNAHNNIHNNIYGKPQKRSTGQSRGPISSQSPKKSSFKRFVLLVFIVGIGIYVWRSRILSTSKVESPSSNVSEVDERSPIVSTPPLGERSLPADHRGNFEKIKKADSHHSGSLGAPAQHKQELMIEQFKEVTEYAFRSIPTIEALQALDASEVHDMPEKLNQAGIALGRVAQAIQDHPELANEGMDFYKRCAKTDDFPSSVRALCYFSLKGLGAAHHVEIAEGDYPAEVRELATELE